MLLGTILVTMVLSLVLCKTTYAGAKEGGAVNTIELRSIANVLDDLKPDESLHIIYVHGMNAEGPGFSSNFKNVLCNHLGSDCDPRRLERRVFEIKDELSDYKYLGREIWNNKAEEAASRPFTDRYRITDRVFIDEFNWWPLLFPIKCRLVLQQETQLAGADVEHLKKCATDDSENRYYPWISIDQFKEIISSPPISGGATLFNKWAKNKIMNWGFADATIALGGISETLREAVESAFKYSKEGVNGKKGRYVVIAESLGSFVILDALVEGKPNVESVLKETEDIYFFANQIALLELARLSKLPPPGPEEVQKGSRNDKSLFGALSRVGGYTKSVSRDQQSDDKKTGPEKQIIAFSDPSDLLTYHVPEIGNWKVSNIYVRNSCGFLGIFEEPGVAHTGHSANPSVLNSRPCKIPSTP
jgi:hypothetical protein